MSTFDPNEARQEMIQYHLRARGITDPRVLRAMAEVPRERFLPAAMETEAYADRALPIDCEQTISQPYIVAYMSQLLRATSDHRVLEIGTGSGYQTAVLAHFVKHVYTVERISQLSEWAGSILTELQIDNVSLRIGDGSRGWYDEAPFDRIIVTAAAPLTPTALVDQLDDGGRLVIPVGDRRTQEVICVEKQGTETTETSHLPCRFVKLVGDQGWPES